MNPRELIRTSKFLSLVLRHQPEIIGIALDENGWTKIDTLLNAANAHGHTIDRDRLVKIVRENDKQRFAISNDGLRIRANQGHSIKVELDLSPSVPPRELYHGTVQKFLPSIREQGLLPGSRQHVHLSANRQTAATVGQRRGKPVILLVDAERMSLDDFTFYQSQNGVWLTNHVPASYLHFPNS